MAGVIALVFYVLVGIAYSLWLGSTIRFLDEGWMLKIGHHLAAGHGFTMDGVQLTAERPPGYAWFLALCELCGSSVAGVRIVHFFLLAATIWMCWRWFLPEFKETGLALMTVAVMAYPALAYTAGTLYPQTVSAFLFIAALGLIARPEPRIGSLVGGGLIYGLLILTTPTFGLTLLVILAVLVLQRWLRWHQALLVFVVAGLTVLPWTVRNYVVFRQIIPISSNSGYNLLAGNSPVSRFDTGSTDELVTYLGQNLPPGLDELERDRRCRQLAIDWIRSHPREALILYCKKTLNYFNLWNSYWTQTKDVSRAKENVQAVTYALLLGLLAWRFMDWKRLPLSRLEVLFLAVYVLTAFTQAIFITRIRYRLPYDFLLIIVVTRYLGSRFLAPFEKSIDNSTAKAHSLN